MDKKKFLEFHENNPEVYALLVEKHGKPRRAGRVRIGFRMLWETVRCLG